MIKVLSHLAHSTFQKWLSEISDCVFYHIISEDTPDLWDHQEVIPFNIRRINLEEVEGRLKTFDLMLLHWHPLIWKWNKWDIPKIFVEHTWPFNDEDVIRFNQLKETMDHVVFITQSSMEAWNKERSEKTSVIYHGIDVERVSSYNRRNKTILTLCNAFASRGWATGYEFWKESVKELENVCLYGFGNAGVENWKGHVVRRQALELLSECGVYFNPSLKSPIPVSVLEAALIGCPIVSYPSCEIPRAFEEGGVIFVRNPGEAKEAIIEVLEDDKMAKELGERAKEIVKEKFSFKKFSESWKDLFERYSRKGEKL